MVRPNALSVEVKIHPKRFDWAFVLSVVLLLAAGLMSLYSIGVAQPKDPSFRKQIFLMALGVVPFAVFFFVPPRGWMRAAGVLYVLNLLMLGAVLVMGQSAGGAQRWLQLGPVQFQPSEMAKLFTVLTLTAFYLNRLDQIKQLSTFFFSLVHVGVPMLLVFAQPHLGATLVLMVIWLSVSIVVGVPWRYLLGFLGALLLLGALAFTVPGILRQYQKDRVLGLFQEDKDGKGFQAHRAKIAFAMGGLTGTGFLKGRFKGGDFVPEQHNDFIFTVIGEEGGLVGCGLILAVFGLFFYRIWLTVLSSTDPCFKMIAAGIFGMLAFHTSINLAMNLELFPVVGLWLPFISYGGTAIWLCLACVGLLLNIRLRERPLLF